MMTRKRWMPPVVDDQGRSSTVSTWRLRARPKTTFGQVLTPGTRPLCRLMATHGYIRRRVFPVEPADVTVDRGLCAGWPKANKALPPPTDLTTGRLPRGSPRPFLLHQRLGPRNGVSQGGTRPRPPVSGKRW